MVLNSILGCLKNPAGHFFLADKTALYYTFSTIAQTLAGSFAILGAFVLFKIQSLNEGFRNLCKLLTQVSSVLGYSEDAYYLEDWNKYIYGFEEAYQRKIKNYKFNSISGMEKQDIEKHIVAFKKNLQLKTRLAMQVYYTFFITAITIILSLICLPLIPTTVHSLFMNIALPITVLLSCICILLYGKILITALELEPLKIIRPLRSAWKLRRELKTEKKKQKPKDE